MHLSEVSERRSFFCPYHQRIKVIGVNVEEKRRKKKEKEKEMEEDKEESNDVNEEDLQANFTKVNYLKHC